MAELGPPAGEPLFAQFARRAKSGNPASDQDVQNIVDTVNQLDASDYPPEMKLDADLWAIDQILPYKFGHPYPSSPATLALPALVEKWRVNFRALVAEKLPHAYLFGLGSCLFFTLQNDENLLTLAAAGIDRDFREADPDSATVIALDGDYLVQWAWSARGGGWASDVTSDGWKFFGERLAKAQALLEPAWDKHPDEAGIALAMINVELGQGQGRERMELWFGRAVKADPDSDSAYKCKAWYLQPRWYGSLDDEIAFGQQCAAGGNWAGRIPLVFPHAIADIADQDPDVYQDPALWDKLEAVYRTYLERYPDATLYRTFFAKHAYDGGHRAIALEQFKILGDNWDREVLSESEHATIADALKL